MKIKSSSSRSAATDDPTAAPMILWRSMPCLLESIVVLFDLMESILASFELMETILVCDPALNLLWATEKFLCS